MDECPPPSPIVSILDESEKSIEQQIDESEKLLGIKDNLGRQLEASLFIDNIFLRYTLITGVTDNPERVFGDKAWADYLDGRLFAREYGTQDLTPDFIRQLHTRLTQRTDPQISGKIREIGLMGASYDDANKPITYTAEQIEAITTNPLLFFRRHPINDVTSTTGFIIYPHLISGPQNQDAILKDLTELCEWFNTVKKQGQYNPFEIAGLLQHRLVSLHPFLDGNGRLSRLLMNWSLENDGETPSVIDYPGEDILTTEDKWISYIEAGNKQYKQLKERQRALERAGVYDLTALFNLGQDKAFFEYIFKYLQPAPSIPTNGEKHTHGTYEEFIANFRNEMNRFQESMRLTSRQNPISEESDLFQGGLITPAFMDFATSPNAQVLPLELREQFFSKVEAYRGCIVEGIVDDYSICQIFRGYSGIGTGYRSLKSSHLPAVSLKGVSGQVIKESMDYYNKLIASTYFRQHHHNLENPYANMPDLNTTLREHTNGRESIWKSPFVSTSLDLDTSMQWAKRFSAPYALGAKHGILFKTRLPREGMVMTFGPNIASFGITDYQHEHEVLVAGGLQPASLTGLEVFDRDAIHSNPSLRVTRQETDYTFNLVIEDRRGKYLEKRTYTYNPNDGGFSLTKREASETFSETPMTQTISPEPQEEIDLTAVISAFTKQYKTPFSDNDTSPPFKTYNIPPDIGAYITLDNYNKIENQINLKLLNTQPVILQN